VRVESRKPVEKVTLFLFRQCGRLAQRQSRVRAQRTQLDFVESALRVPL
jgi:hypothetical protein